MTSSVMPAPSPARTGVWIGIAAISMAFAAFTSALLVRQGAAPDWRHFDLPRILYANTFVLLLSSGTIAIAARRLTAAWELAADRPPGAVVGAGAGVAWLVVTLLLGLLFVAGQLFAWRSLAAQGLYLATNPSSSFFYVFTAAHALHLLGGIVALGYLLLRLQAEPARPRERALAAVTLYWHFMDALWLYLLLVLALRL
jgi:cytochrome c oxidase subunit 3